MIDPTNEESGIGGFTELAEWTRAATIATKPAVELTEELLAFVVPSGYKVEKVDISSHVDARAERPRFRQGAVVVNTVESFIDYVNRHSDSQTTLWVQDDGIVTAVLDDHQGLGAGVDENLVGYPGWGKHRATLRLIPTPAWTRWAGASGQLMEQQQFAELIEASIPDIVRPDAADMLEIAQSIQITRTAGFSSDMRLRSGTVKFHYTEDDNASAGDLEIPQTIVLFIAPYLGTDPIELPARFVYRMSGGKLKLGFVIDRLGEILLEVRDELATTIRVGAGIKPFAGTPRS